MNKNEHNRTEKRKKEKNLTDRIIQGGKRFDLVEKYCIQETMNILACADGSNDTKSCMLPVSCH